MVEQVFYGFVVFVVLYVLAGKWDKCKHLRFVWDASNKIKRLNRLKTKRKKLEFLRSVNPFIFEEMLLTTFKRRGWQVRRNKRYTGDGGIDGMVKYKGQWCVIQAKRYKNYINAKDVAELSRICRYRGVKGLFIHTGKTRKKSRDLAADCPRVQIVSGAKLLQLLRCD